MSSVWGLEAQTEIQKRLAEADLGYLRMDIVNPFCGADAWGFYNNRPLDRDKVQKMREMFHSMGPLPCQTDKVIYLPLNPVWFEPPTTSEITGKYVYEVPIIKLTEAGEKALAAGEIHPLSGNHRRAALVLYHGDLVDALAALEIETEGLGNVELERKQREIDVMKNRVENAPFWVIKVYDIGE